MNLKPLALLKDFTAFGVIAGILPGLLIGLIYASILEDTELIYIITGFCFGVVIGAISGMTMGIITLLIRPITYSVAQYRALMAVTAVILTGLMTWVVCTYMANFALFADPVISRNSIFIAIFFAIVASRQLAARHIATAYGKQKMKRAEYSDWPQPALKDSLDDEEDQNRDVDADEDVRHHRHRLF